MTRPVGVQRSVGTVIILSIVTFGIYLVYWEYKSFQEMKDFSGVGIGGTVGAVLAVFVGIVTVFMLPAEVGNLYSAGGQPKPVSGQTGFWTLIPLAGGIIWFIKVQNSLNQFWEYQNATPASFVP